MSLRQFSHCSNIVEEYPITNPTNSWKAREDQTVNKHYKTKERETKPSKWGHTHTEEKGDTSQKYRSTEPQHKQNSKLSFLQPSRRQMQHEDHNFDCENALTQS